MKMIALTEDEDIASEVLNSAQNWEQEAFERLG